MADCQRKLPAPSVLLPVVLFLLLVPTAVLQAGKGALELRFISPAGHRRLTAGEQSVFRLEVKNISGQAIDDLRLSALAPQNWQLDISPQRLPALRPGRIAEVQVSLAAPRRAEETYYSLTFHARSAAGDETLSVSLWVETPQGRWLTVALILTVALLAAFIVVFLRLSSHT